MPDRLTVFFDGDCAMCNRQMQLLIQADKRERIAFAPLQGKTAERIWQRFPDLKPEPGGSFKSMIAARGLDTDTPTVTLRSNAAIDVARELGGLWRLFTVFRWIPVRIRDAVYNLIAYNRYRWFGKSEQCIWQPDVNPNRFLD